MRRAIFALFCLAAVFGVTSPSVRGWIAGALLSIPAGFMAWHGWGLPRSTRRS